MPEESKCINMHILHRDPQAPRRLNSGSPPPHPWFIPPIYAGLLNPRLCRFEVRLLLGAQENSPGISPPWLCFRPTPVGLKWTSVPVLVSWPLLCLMPKTLLPQRAKTTARPSATPTKFQISDLLFFFFFDFEVVSHTFSVSSPPTRADTVPYLSPHSSSAATGSLIRKSNSWPDARVEPQTEPCATNIRSGDRRRRKGAGKENRVDS